LIAVGGVRVYFSSAPEREENLWVTSDKLIETHSPSFNTHPPWLVSRFMRSQALDSIVASRETGLGEEEAAKRAAAAAAAAAAVAEEMRRWRFAVEEMAIEAAPAPGIPAADETDDDDDDDDETELATGSGG
jgi:hypothetical protein